MKYNHAGGNTRQRPGTVFELACSARGAPNRRQFRADVRARRGNNGDRACGNCTKFLLSKATNRCRESSGNGNETHTHTKKKKKKGGKKKNRGDFLVVVKSDALGGINPG